MAARARGIGIRSILVAFVLLMAVTSMPTTAEAIPPALRPSTRPMFATFALGPAIEISDSWTQFKLEQAFGYHFFGGGSGPAIGGAISEAFGKGVFVFSVAPRFWWDIQPVQGLGLYIAPFAQLGFAIASGSGDSRAFFNMQFGVEPRLVINNRIMVFWKIMAFDINIGGDFSPIRYDMLFGAGATF
jgi:hypothetical protein